MHPPTQSYPDATCGPPPPLLPSTISMTPQKIRLCQPLSASLHFTQLLHRYCMAVHRTTRAVQPYSLAKASKHQMHEIPCILATAEHDQAAIVSTAQKGVGLVCCLGVASNPWLVPKCNRCCPKHLRSSFWNNLHALAAGCCSSVQRTV